MWLNLETQQLFQSSTLALMDWLNTALTPKKDSLTLPMCPLNLLQEIPEYILYSYNTNINKYKYIVLEGDYLAVSNSFRDTFLKIK